MNKLISCLQTSPQRRQLSDLLQIAQKINDPKGFQYSIFVALYSKLHIGPDNITNLLEPQTILYLLSGSITYSKFNQKQKISFPAKLKVKQSMKITLDDNSCAISITQSQTQNCQSLVKSSIVEEIQFLKTIYQFANLSRIVCQNLVYQSIIRIYYKGQQVPKFDDCLYLIREGEFQSYQEQNFELDSKRGRYQNPLIIFSKGLFVKVSNNLRCKSSVGRIYCFKDEFVRNYIEVICGDKITEITQKRQKYISQKSKSVDSTKRICLNYLTQTKFRVEPKLEKRSISVRRLSLNLRSKKISSRNSQEGFSEYQELEKLEEKKNRCFVYKKLFPLNLNKKQDILSRMYKSIKDDLQTRDKEKREAKKTLIF